MYLKIELYLKIYGNVTNVLDETQQTCMIVCARDTPPPLISPHSGALQGVTRT